MKAMLISLSVFMFAWSIGYAQQIKTNPAINKQVAGTQVLTNKSAVKVNGNVPFLNNTNKKVLASGSNPSFTLSKTPKQTINRESGKKKFVENGRYCTEVQVSAEKGDYERVVLGNQNDKIFPGAIYFDNAITTGAYNAPNNLNLLSYEITTDLFSAASSSSSTIMVQPNVGGVNDGIMELMKRNTKVKTPSRVSVDVKSLNSVEQLAFEIGAGFTGYGVDLNAELNSLKRTSKNVFIAKLTQVYFSVFLNKQNGKSLITNAESMPNLVYVNKVNYGRLGYLMIASDSAQESIRAALDFQYNQGSAAARANADVRFNKLLNSLEIKGFFFGGDASNTVNVNSPNSLGEFDRYVKNGLQLNPNVPPVAVSYEMKYMNDNASVATNSTVSYTERICNSAKGILIDFHNVAIDQIHGGDCSYAWGTVRVELWETDDSKTPVKIIASKDIWNKAKNDPQRNVINYDDIRQNRRPAAEVIKNVADGKWNVTLDPELVAKNNIMVRVLMNVNTNHKDNDLAALGFHGMNRVEKVDRLLSEVLVSKDALQRESAKYKYGTLLAGPFCSNTDRVHCFYAVFTITNF